MHCRVRRPLRIATILGVLLVGAPWILHGVLVAPHAVFIDHRTRTGQVVLVNNGDDPEEITIDLVYGYPATDSAGNIAVRLIEHPDPAAPSAAGWIRAFPRRLRLAPGQRQVVRLLASPPPDLADGEHWTRLIVTARGGTIPVASDDSLVQAGVTLVTRTIISVTYRKGEVRTGIAVTDLRFEPTADSLVTWFGLAREGNAAYLGLLRLTLRDATGRAAGEWELPVGVYYTQHRRVAFPLDAVPPGRYTAELLLTTDRPDIEQTLPVPPVRRTAAVELP